MITFTSVRIFFSEIPGQSFSSGSPARSHKVGTKSIPETKRLEIGLTTLFGVGRSEAQRILDKTGVDWGTKAKELSPEKENEIKKVIESMKIEGDLKREISGNKIPADNHTDPVPRHIAGEYGEPGDQAYRKAGKKYYRCKKSYQQFIPGLFSGYR